MPKVFRFLSMASLAVTMIGLRPSPVYAGSPWPAECVESSLPSGDPRYPDDQLILTCLPRLWNGQLVLYAHGYVQPQEELALPLDELTLPNGQTVPEVLLPLGYGFATTSYHKTGFALEQAEDDLNALVDYFEDVVTPHRQIQTVLLTGASEGGIITAMMIERHPDIYDGGLSLCGPIGGMPYQIQYFGDFRVVFDYFFPDVFPFGATDVPPTAYLDWESVYVPAITSALLSNPSATDQLFAVTGAARDLADPNTVVTTSLEILQYSLFATNDGVAVAGGQPYGNRLVRYHGSADDVALNAGVERVAAEGAGRNYMRQFYETTGHLQRPLVTLHTLLDPQIPFIHQLIYKGKVTLAGQGARLTQIPANRYDHCNFTTNEVLGAFALLTFKVNGTVDESLQDEWLALSRSLR